MSPRHASTLLAALCVSFTALPSTGCDNDGSGGPVGPSSLDTTAPFVSKLVSIRTTAIVPYRTPGARCPAIPPFLAPFDLTIAAHGASDLFLREIRMQFIDIAGVSGGFRTIIGNEFGSLFPSTRIPAFGAKTFPVSLGFGCVGGRTGVVDVLVVAADSAGRESRTSAQMTVR